MKTRALLLAFTIPFTASAAVPEVAHDNLKASGGIRDTATVDTVNVRWDSPSENSAGSMPLGNGEVVVNAWVEKATGDLLLLVARTDALAETGRFCKLGRLRLHLEGGPLLKGGDFRQELRLREGVLAVTGGGVSLSVFVDSGAQVLHVTGESKVPVVATATVESWRDSVLEMGYDLSCWSLLESPIPAKESADVFMVATNNSVAWYHRNEQEVRAASPARSSRSPCRRAPVRRRKWRRPSPRGGAGARPISRRSCRQSRRGSRCRPGFIPQRLPPGVSSTNARRVVPTVFCSTRIPATPCAWLWARGVFRPPPHACRPAGGSM